MRIDNNIQISDFYVNNGVHKLTHGTSIFRFPDLGETAISSYQQSERYLQLNEMVKKYDLTNKSFSTINPLALESAKFYRKDFIKEFGNVKSASMQDLILSSMDVGYDKSLTTRINAMRTRCREDGIQKYAENLTRAVKVLKIGNCTDVSLISKNKINNSNNNLRGELVYATILKDKTFSNHVAVLVSDGVEKQELKNDSIILDNWLGGVFRYKDWIKILSNLYGTRDINTYLNES